MPASFAVRCTRHTRLLAGVLFYVLVLGGCATRLQSPGLQAGPPADLPPRAELSRTPFFPQQAYQCGPAALATVFNYYQHAVSPEQLVASVYLPAREGSLQIELTATARRHGMLAYPLRKEMVDLLQEVAAGHPVLVLQNLAFSWLPRWHYAVVVGYDLPNGELVLRSGTTRRWQTTLATFERTWRRAAYWALVIVPAGTIPATAEPLRYLAAAYDLEQVGQAAAAYRAYAAGVERWPRTAPLWLTLGNLALRRQRPAVAVQALLQASRLQPDDPAVWNNLAYALRAAGCPRQARQAVSCALARAPQDTNIRDSAMEMRRRSETPQAADCPQFACPSLRGKP
jgi:tetratricopeptide (TPR) repeat protein